MESMRILQPGMKFGLSAVLMLFATARASGQLELIEIETPFTAHSLSGIVVDPTGAPVPGAVVEECGAPFTPIEVKNMKGQSTGDLLHGDCTKEPNRILARAETNKRGHFSLRQSKAGGTHYLHVSSPGFDPMQISVKLKFFARTGVKIQLHIAT